MSEFHLKIVEILLFMPSACFLLLEGGVHKQPIATVMQIHLQLWSQLAEKLCVPHGDFCSFSGIKFASGIEDFGDLFPLPTIIMQLRLWNPTFLVLNPGNSHNPGTGGAGTPQSLANFILLVLVNW